MDEYKTHQCTVWANVEPLVLKQTVHKTKEFSEFGKTSYYYTESSKKMDGILNRYNLKSTGRIYTFGVLKCIGKFEVLDLP